MTDLESSMKLRGEKAITKWMRWEVENNDPPASMDELWEILAVIVMERIIRVERKAGPGRPRKEPANQEQDVVMIEELSEK